MNDDSRDAMPPRRHEAGAYRRIELITGTQRRRRWTADEKAAIVAASALPGVNVLDIVRQYGVNRGLLQTWRRAAARRDPVFLPLRVEAATDSGMASGEAVIEIEGRGLRVRLRGPAYPVALRVVLDHLGRRG